MIHGQTALPYTNHHGGWPNGIVNNNNLLTLPYMQAAPGMTTALCKSGLSGTINHLLMAVVGLVSFLLNGVLTLIPLKLPLLESLLGGGGMGIGALKRDEGDSKIKSGESLRNAAKFYQYHRHY